MLRISSWKKKRYGDQRSRCRTKRQPHMKVPISLFIVAGKRPALSHQANFRACAKMVKITTVHSSIKYQRNETMSRLSSLSLPTQSPMGDDFGPYNRTRSRSRFPHHIARKRSSAGVIGSLATIMPGPFQSKVAGRGEPGWCSDVISTHGHGDVQGFNSSSPAFLQWPLQTRVRSGRTRIAG